MQINFFKWKLLVPMLFWASMISAASELTVIGLNGAEQQYALSIIGKITFNNSVMYLYDHNGTLLGSTDISKGGRIVVVDTEEALENLNASVSVFADPVQQQLIINGIPENQILRIFDISGKLLMTSNSQCNQTRIDVSRLQNGTYLLQLGANVVKFVKQ